MAEARRLADSDTATVEALERDGLVHRAGARLVLGGVATAQPPITIER
jgi:hypothetical protein